MVISYTCLEFDNIRSRRRPFFLYSSEVINAMHECVCVKRVENTAHEECVERGMMSPSDYERKPRAAEKSRHVILEEKLGEDKHKTGLGECPKAKANPGQTSLGQWGEGGARVG